MVTAHSVAAMIKQDLYANYQTFVSDANWAFCRTSGGAVNYVGILANPTDLNYAARTSCASRQLDFIGSQCEEIVVRPRAAGARASSRNAPDA